MKPKIKYDVNVLGMKNKKSMMKNFFFTKKPCSIMNQRLPHSSFNKFSLVCVNKNSAENKADFRLEKAFIFCT